MEATGIRIDVPYLQELGQSMGEKLQQLEAEKTSLEGEIKSLEGQLTGSEALADAQKEQIAQLQRFKKGEINVQHSKIVEIKQSDFQ